MDTTTLLIIIVISLLVGGGWYGRGRRYMNSAMGGTTPLDFQQPVFEWSIRLSKSEAAFLL